MILSIGTLISMLYVVVEFNEKAVVTDYLKAVDIWTGTCITFAFGGVVELVMISFLLNRRKPHGQHLNESQGDLDDSSIPMVS